MTPGTPRERGFTLLEVLVATSILAVVSIGVVQLFGMAAVDVHRARKRTLATILASAKIEQLRALVWSFEPGGAGTPAVPRSDRVSDLSSEPATPSGTGLSESPPGTLAANTPGWFEYLDGSGQWVGNGGSAPPRAVFVRRWSVQPFRDGHDRTLALQVFAISLRDERQRPLGFAGVPSGEGALVATILTRKAR